MMSAVAHALLTDPVTQEVQDPQDLIKQLMMWRDRARRHARFDEARWFTSLIGTIQAELDQKHHHVDGGASSA